MFEEIPSRPPETISTRWAIAVYASYFALCMGGAVIFWIRWSHPWSLVREFEMAQVIVFGLLAGWFLLGAKTATPEANRKRTAGLLIGFTVFRLIIDVIR